MNIRIPRPMIMHIIAVIWRGIFGSPSAIIGGILIGTGDNSSTTTIANPLLYMMKVGWPIVNKCRLHYYFKDRKPKHPYNNRLEKNELINKESAAVCTLIDMLPIQPNQNILSNSLSMEFVMGYLLFIFSQRVCSLFATVPARR